MQARLTYRSPSNPLLRLAAGALALIGLATAAVLGLFLLAALIGLGALAGLLIYLRLWWLRRQMRRQDTDEQGATHEERVVIEGEYREVHRQADKS
ncbi:hypothetical protein [Alkalilimnicola sp. S0819]|uniref:hypothetical protein n=1 Tax=Alkalilimnicola sp. S0819 TaxID=2613922 RepID=UPI00126247B8|nr:hypothetical protein [Alkalilimnicola sp. S0819]KAB7623697.1 hypothetical protein F3N43_09275 [Alkalilimnicola sp. S0819]MPQ16826.1 hypothetical protein [Alkalilimnicola sp. S0819]